MYVEVICGLTGQPVRLPCTQVLVCADNGTPLSMSVAVGDAVRTSHAGEPGFNRDLSAYGIRKTVMVTSAQQQSRPPAGAKLWTP